MGRLQGQGRPGAELRAILKGGAHAYVAVSGGIDVPEVLGRQPLDLCTQRPRRLPGPGARHGLRPWPLGRPSLPSPARHAGRDSVAARPLYWQLIPKEAGRNLFEDDWKVAPEANRIGYRFRGSRPFSFEPREQLFGAGSDPSNIVDGCHQYGSIQVPGGPEPIVLHRDAVSGGGYCTLGAIISAGYGPDQPAAAAHPHPLCEDRHGDRAHTARRDRASLIACLHDALL